MSFVPEGYCAVVQGLKHADLDRGAAITYGINTTAPASTQMANDLNNHFALTMGDNIDTNVVIGPTKLGEGSASGETVWYESTNPVSGGASGDASAPNVATLFRKISGLPGRKHRGRIYVPWMGDEGAVDEAGNWSVVAQTALQNTATAWLEGLSDVDGVAGMVILHAEGPLTPTGVIALVADNRVATQRRRMSR